MHIGYWWKLWLATRCWNYCCFVCSIHKLLCCYRNYNCIMLSLGNNLHFKWNSLYFEINLLIILNINSLWKFWHRRNLLLGSSDWNCNNRNLQTLIMFRCHYKLVHSYRMCFIVSFYSLHNIWNSLHFISHLLIILSIIWLCSRNGWCLLLGNNRNSSNKYNRCHNFISLSTKIMHRFIINFKCFLCHCNCRSQMRF